MPARLTVVRVVMWKRAGSPRSNGAFEFDPEDPRTGAWLESLRYAQLLVVHRDDEDGVCFDLLPPRGVSADRSALWAKMNAERMSSLGYCAAVAPAAGAEGLPETVSAMLDAEAAKRRREEEARRVLPPLDECNQPSDRACGLPGIDCARHGGRR